MSEQNKQHSHFVYDEGPDPNAIRRGWYFVIEPENGAYAPEAMRIETRDGRCITKKAHGYPARVEVTDGSGQRLPRVTLLRAADAAGNALERLGDSTERALRVVLGPAGTATEVKSGPDGIEVLHIDGTSIAGSPSHHPVYADVMTALLPGRGTRSAFAANPQDLPASPLPRAMFFESLMNTEMEHNDREISQGVLHMLSPLKDMDTEVVLANVKMSIFQKFRNDPGTDPVLIGLENLEEALAGGRIGLVCITLLEAYFHNVIKLIARLRELGCNAHIAVGGVMATLSPDMVAAHLPDVSFICRGAGEYFVPELCRILGDAQVDVPLTDAQRSAMLNMDGLTVVDQAGERLMLGNNAKAMQVDDLDRVDLDLSHLRRDHLVHGVEISTSRGCIYRCTFCTIIGQKTFQARSAGSIIDLLNNYAERYKEIFGDNIPPRVWRVHISDDDFACDRERAALFFRELLKTPFRLASCQVSIADLCKRRGTKLLYEPDEELLDSLTPEVFFDNERPITTREYIEDHRERRWSAHLQAGVESFNDPELARHGKGYKLEHIRVAMKALSERGLHLDAYYIISHAATSAEELLDGLEEACRLKLQYPVHFHVKYPLTPRLVSIVPSASYRRHLRMGTTDAIKVTEHAQEPNHPEYDYPFADHDVPWDQWVETAVQVDFFNDRHRYTGSMAALSDQWGPRLADMAEDDPERLRGERLMRRLDDATRRWVFWLLEETGIRPSGGDLRDGTRVLQQQALETAVEILGPAGDWLPTYRRSLVDEPLTVELLFDGQDADGAAPGMGERRVQRALGLMSASSRDERVLRVVAEDSDEALDVLIPTLAAGRAVAGITDVELMLATPTAALLKRMEQAGIHPVWTPTWADTPEVPDVLRAAKSWSAMLPVSAKELQKLSGAVRALMEAGARQVRLRVDEADEPSRAELTRELKRIPRTMAAALLSEHGELPIITVLPDGQLRAHDAGLGALSDLRNPDRYQLDTTRQATSSERILRSFIDWAGSLSTPKKSTQQEGQRAD